MDFQNVIMPSKDTKVQPILIIIYADQEQKRLMDVKTILKIDLQQN